MNAYGAVIKPARTALILFAVSVALSFAAVVGIAKYRAQKERSVLQSEQQLAATRDNIRKLTYDMDSINRLAAKYKKLTALGFIGEPDRDGWVQGIESLYRDTHLPPTLRYTLATPQLLNPQILPEDNNLAYQNNISHHDLAFELSTIHEGEFLDFMESIGRNWQIPYRIDTCQMSRDEADQPITGLKIKCTVQIYSLPTK
ncbi:MAG: hypothetical protein PHP85_04915 [Gallionella sp.]|nr:hypothetical protein [Gallionella sp.]